MHDRTRVREIFAEAINLPKEKLDTYLDAACAGDQDLRSEVLSLLGALERKPEFLSAPTTGGTKGGEFLGARIGPYKLIEQIGHGGFGTVYRAEQESPIRRQVAIKIIKLGMDTRAVIDRFEAERQALAMMDHEHIAKVFDAGATPSGRPYFVMELVRGEPITSFADREKLSVNERLELFLQVCRAVQHAHSKGIIHRDIKPGNVLIARQDGRPLAKVIDFGIAKATDPHQRDATRFTEFQQLLGTPEYMSPEQAGGAPDIDTRSDIYSLGVLLYELLAGEPPFTGKELRSAAYAELQRIIREVDPPRPSTRLSHSAAIGDVAAHRRIEPAQLSRVIAGDLDWIVMKSIDKDRTRRYETVSTLATDIERHLTGRPVVAAPPSAGYIARKFVTRHRTAVLAGVVVLTALILGIAGTSWGLVSARAAERRARAEADHATSVRDFLSQTMAGVSPQVALGRDTALISELMNKAVTRIEAGELKGNTDAERELRVVIAGVYTDIARFDEAMRVLRPVLEGDPSAITPSLHLRAELLGGRIAVMTSDWKSADKRLNAVLDSMSTTPVPDEIARCQALALLGNAALDRSEYDRAIDLLSKAVAAARKATSADEELLLNALSSLGSALAFRGRYDDSAKTFEEAMRIVSRPTLHDSPALVDALIARSDLLSATNARESIANMRKAVDTARRIFPDPHPKTALALHDLGAAHYQTAEFEDALLWLRQAAAMRRRLFGDHAPQTLESLAAIGSALFQLGRFDEAIQAQQETIQAFHANAPEGSFDEAHEYMMLANSFHGLARMDDAVEAITHSVEMFRKFSAPDEPKAAAAATIQADYLREAGRYEQAAACFRALIAERRAKAASSPSLISGAQMGLAEVLFEIATPDALREAESLLRESLATRRKSEAESSLAVTFAKSALGRAIVLQLGPTSPPTRLQEAEQLLTSSHSVLQGIEDQISPQAKDDRMRRLSAALVSLYTTWEQIEPGAGKAAQAAAWRRISDSLAAPAQR